MDLDARIKELMAFKVRIEAMIDGSDAAAHANVEKATDQLDRHEAFVQRMGDLIPLIEKVPAIFETVEELVRTASAAREELSKTIFSLRADLDRVEALAALAAAQTASQAPAEKPAADVAPKDEQAPQAAPQVAKAPLEPAT